MSAKVGFLEAANWYAEKGMPVLPLQQHLKIPLPGSRGSSDATTDPAIIEAWFDNNFGYNLGVATGGRLVVLDIDLKPDEDGRKTLGMLENEHGKLPKTFTVTTPSGGYHLYFQLPADVTIKGNARKYGEGFDIRGQGNYVLAPPSHTEASSDPKGKTCTGDYTVLHRVAIAELPAAWIKLLSSSVAPKAAPYVNGAVPGQVDYAQMAEALSALAMLDPADGETWTEAMYGFAGSFGEAGYMGFDQWSQSASNYDEAENHKRYLSCIGMNKTVATVFKMAQSVGWTNPRKGIRPDGTPAKSATGQQSGFNQPPPFQAEGSAKQGDDIEDDLLLICAGDVETRAVEWAIPDYIAAGKVNLFAGVGGAGKSTICCDLIASMTTGRPFANGKATTPGDVIVFAPEDDAGDTLKPRLEAAGADLTRVHFVAGWMTQGGGTRHFDPIRDVPRLVAALKRIKPKALILDPVTTLVDNQNDNAKVRMALQPLVDLGKEIGTAIIAISHFRKGQGDPSDSIDDRVMGSQAWTAVARMVLYCVKSADGEKVFFKGKSNIAKINEGFLYDIDIDKTLKDNTGKTVTTPKVLWGEYIADDDLAEILHKKPDSDAPTALQVAKDFLTEFLADGECLGNEVQEEAKKRDISMSTLRRAKTELGIKNRKRRKDEPDANKWAWYIEDNHVAQETPHGKVGQVEQVTDHGMDTEEYVF